MSIFYVYDLDQMIFALSNLNPGAYFAKNISKEGLEEGIYTDSDLESLVLPPAFFYDKEIGITNRDFSGIGIKYYIPIEKIF